ncbi:hypothetical protein WJX84_007340, partial [Apatococcus fuscideae]
ASNGLQLVASHHFHVSGQQMILQRAADKIHKAANSAGRPFQIPVIKKIQAKAQTRDAKVPQAPRDTSLVAQGGKLQLVERSPSLAGSPAQVLPWSAVCLQPDVQLDIFKASTHKLSDQDFQWVYLLSRDSDKARLKQKCK